MGGNTLSHLRGLVLGKAAPFKRLVGRIFETPHSAQITSWRVLWWPDSTKSPANKYWVMDRTVCFARLCFDKAQGGIFLGSLGSGGGFLGVRRRLQCFYTCFYVWIGSATWIHVDPRGAGGGSRQGEPAAGKHRCGR